MSKDNQMNKFKKAYICMASKIFFNDSTAGAFLLYSAVGATVFVIIAFYLWMAEGHNIILNATTITSKLLAWLGLAYGTMQKVGAPLEKEINILRKSQNKAELLSKADEAPWTHYWLWFAGFIFLMLATICDTIKASH